MSNYYISKCCGAQTKYITSGEEKAVGQCTECLEMSELEAIINNMKIITTYKILFSILISFTLALGAYNLGKYNASTERDNQIYYQAYYAGKHESDVAFWKAIEEMYNDCIEFPYLGHSIDIFPTKGHHSYSILCEGIIKEVN